MDKAIEFQLNDFVQTNRGLETLTDPDRFVLHLMDVASLEIIGLRNRLAAAYRRVEKLRALEEMGVDNWEGYSDAMQLLPSDDDLGD